MNKRSDISARLIDFEDGWTVAEYVLLLCLLIVAGAALSLLLNAGH